VTKDD
jgi:mitogen-activated protein kinase 1/3